MPPAMHLRLAVGMTVVPLIERRWRFGDRFTLGVGVGFIVLAPVALLGPLTPWM
jgi:hypothetical protein